MDDLRTRAQLVSFDSASAADAISTVITRAEIAETAARGEFPATLLLDLDRVETGDEGEVTAHATVAVDWDQNTIDELLASTEDEDITLWFDARELARAFDEDEVEGHGLRQKAAVLAIAVAAAGVSTTPAMARFAADNSDGGAGGTAGFVAPQAQHQVPIGGAERALQIDEKLSAGASTSGFSVDPQARQEGPTVQPAGAERGLLQDEQLAVNHTQSTESATTSSGSGPSSGELAAFAGLGALLISAAGFGVTRKRTPPAQPA